MGAWMGLERNDCVGEWESNYRADFSEFPLRALKYQRET